MLRDERAKSARMNPAGAVADAAKCTNEPADLHPNEPGGRFPERTQEAD
jgi:hypothetical protein